MVSNIKVSFTSSKCETRKKGQEYRFKKTYETSYFLKGRKQNDFMNKKYKKVCITLSCMEH